MTTRIPSQSACPVIMAALGEDWWQLPEALRCNFNVRPGSNDRVHLSGRMYEVWHSRPAKPFIYAARGLGALVPWQGTDIPTQITLYGRPDDQRFVYWRREHRFPGRAPTVFASRMEYAGSNELVEHVRLGMGMRASVSLEGDSLKITSRCYQCDLGRPIAIPHWLLLGKGTIIERAVSRDEFEMFFEIHHPLFGKTFSYSGIFRIEQAPDLRERER